MLLIHTESAFDYARKLARRLVNRLRRVTAAGREERTRGLTWKRNATGKMNGMVDEGQMVNGELGLKRHREQAEG